MAARVFARHVWRSLHRGHKKPRPRHFAVLLTWPRPVAPRGAIFRPRSPLDSPAGWGCLPTKADRLPSGGLWIHEIKHDAFHIVARKNGAEVRLYSRPGNDLTERFPLIAETLANLRTCSCIIDGEAVACDGNGLAVFERIRYRRHDDNVFLYASDLIELDGDDLRREPLDVRKATLRSLLIKAGPGLRWNEHIEGDGETIFCLQARARRDRVEAKGLALPLWSLARLAQDEEPGCACGEARGACGGLPLYALDLHMHAIAKMTAIAFTAARS
jgi:bifunctional non-homologous end joining protein LigD